ALDTALKRHVGKIVSLYGSSGKIQAAEGKDLTGVKYFLATGGALTKLPNGKNIIESYLAKKKTDLLLPGEKIKVLIDRKYIMASVGVIADKYPDAAKALLFQSLEVL
ncbi:MAG TPA: glutamate mutase L, partial [Bacilli bacterium]